MEFNDWQQWRSVSGKRPKRAVDGYTTLSAAEADLWRSTMAAVHGSNWKTELRNERSVSPGSTQEKKETSYVSMSTGSTPRKNSKGSTEGDDDKLSDSWHSDDPGCPGTLAARILKGYHPER